MIQNISGVIQYILSTIATRIELSLDLLHNQNRYEQLIHNNIQRINIFYNLYIPIPIRELRNNLDIMSQEDLERYYKISNLLYPTEKMNELLSIASNILNPDKYNIVQIVKYKELKRIAGDIIETNKCVQRLSSESLQNSMIIFTPQISYAASALAKTAIIADYIINLYQLINVAQDGYLAYKEERYEDMNDAALSILLDSVFFAVTRFGFPGIFSAYIIVKSALYIAGSSLYEESNHAMQLLHCGAASTIDSIFEIAGRSFEVSSCNVDEDNNFLDAEDLSCNINDLNI